MPCAVEATDELDQLTVAPDEEVRRDPKVRNRREVRVAAWLEAIGEEVDDAVAAELPGGQRDAVYDDQADGCAAGSCVTVGGADLPREAGVAAFVDGEISAWGAHGAECYPGGAICA